MPELRVPVPEVPKPAPNVNEVRLRLEAIRFNARSAMTAPLPHVSPALDSLARLADQALTFLPEAEPSSEGA